MEKGRWKLLRASRSGASVSHLLFTDDILFFAEAREDQAACILVGIREFSASTGQNINLAKSSVFFSPNFPDQTTRRLSSLLDIKRTLEMGKYLGHYIQHDGRNSGASNILVERIWLKLDGWKPKCLSRAGRLTLAKTVINGMGSFQMQALKLPSRVHKQLDKLVRHYVQGGHKA